ncbi:MAG: porin family protein [Alphaproteobacteria bacterium]|nr:porin family protein [Alphaproteobacteria bacterium]
MKKLLLLSAVCLIATSASAFEVKPYIEGRISENFMRLKVQDTDGDLSQKVHDNLFQGGGLEVGAKLDQFRIGLEGYYNDKAEADLTVGEPGIFTLEIPIEFKSKGVFLNGYWDIPMCEKLKKVKPYIGAGIGYSWLGMSVNQLGHKDTVKDKDLGWNVGLGAAYELNDNLDLTLGYRYEDLGKVKKDDIKVNFKNHKVSLGLRYTF